MREILFRGKSVNGIGWIEGSLRITTIQPADDAPFKHYEIEDTTCGVFPSDFMSGVCETVDPETVGQYTGLTDKNGTKIFEGDILSTENGTFRNTGMGHVLFYKGMWTSFYGQDAIGRDCFDELHTVCNSREVIGNIHDNPELLEGE